MTLTYLGHCAFLWTSPGGVRVVIDPYGNEPGRFWFLRPFPPLEAHVVLTTHAHFDHDAVHRVGGRPSVLRGDGSFRLGDVSVEGVADLHAGAAGRRGMRNTVFVVEVAGVRYCHLGDNRPHLPAEARRRLGRVDVLMLPVDDSCHLLSYQEADALVEALAPSVVVPMHYFIPELTTVGSTLKGLEGWLRRHDRVRDMAAALELTPAALPQEREVWVLRSLAP